MSINEVASVEDEFDADLGDEETLSSDVGIFSLRIFSVWGEANTFSMCFVGVTGAMSGGAGRGGSVSPVDA